MMRRMRMVLWGVAACLVVFDGAFAVDRVRRRSSDTPLSGVVSRMSRTEVAVKSSAASATERTVAVPEIEYIEWDQEPSALSLRRNDERNGRLQVALNGYREALQEASPTQRHLRSDLEFLIGRVQAKTAFADPAKLEEAIAKLEEFRQNNPQHYRYYESLEFLARLYLAKEEFGPTGGLFAEMRSAPWNDYKMAAQSYEGEVKRLQGDLAGAVAAYDGVIGMEAKTPAEVKRQNEARLGKAACLQQQNRPEEAAALLEEAIDAASEEDAELMAEIYLRKGEILRTQAEALSAAGQAAEATRKAKQAAIAYLHIDVLETLSREPAQHAEALYYLARLWRTLHQADRAAEAEAKLQGDYPESAWARRLGTGG